LQQQIQPEEKLMNEPNTTLLRSRRPLSTIASLIGLAVIAALPAHASSSGLSALATADQKSVEAEAVRLLASPQVQKQIAASNSVFAAQPLAAGDDAKKTQVGAVNELAFATALAAANSDPSRPKIVWGFTAPRTWLGQSVPGSRWGIDNPDNVYRIAPVDGASTYEISVKPSNPGPVQYSFLIYDSFAGEDGKRDHLDTPVAGLRDRDIKTQPDGSFKLTIAPTAVAGAQNLIRSTPAARVLLIRNTFSDWETQNPFAVTIKRIAGPAAQPAPTETELATRAAALLKAGTDSVAEWASKGFTSQNKVNEIAQPFERGGGWGFAAPGKFKIADDEAFVVTLDSVGAKYVGFDLTNPWLVSLEHIHGSGSLNNTQAVRSSDGTYTYVIAAHDPGVQNWLSTDGLHEGQIFIRWQDLPAAASARGAVRSFKVVKLPELQNALASSGLSPVSAAERLQLTQQRAATYARRYASTEAETKTVASR